MSQSPGNNYDIISICYEISWFLLVNKIKYQQIKLNIVVFSIGPCDKVPMHCTIILLETAAMMELVVRIRYLLWALGINEVSVKGNTSKVTLIQFLGHYCYYTANIDYDYTQHGCLYLTLEQRIYNDFDLASSSICVWQAFCLTYFPCSLISPRSRSWKMISTIMLELAGAMNV